MGRIRSIKPEFPLSESIGKLSRDARLLFIQLWTIVDDSGRARASSRVLASLLYPFDDDAHSLIDGWLSELEQAGHVRLYMVDGSQYLDIPNWLKHQKIDRPSKSRLPEFDEGSRVLVESSMLTLDLGPRIKDQISRPNRSDLVQSAKKADDGLSIEFEAWYREYPRHEGRGQAEKAYRAARKNVAAETLLDGARAARVRFTDPQYTPLPATWLNGKRWLDAPAAPLVQKRVQTGGGYA